MPKKRKNKAKRPKIYKTINVFSLSILVFYMSMIGVFFVPKNIGAVEEGAVCPDGNVKYEIGSGYAYTDGSATISGDGSGVIWAPTSGYVVTSVCVKIGGPGGGSLINSDPATEQAGPFAHDISHVVLTTEPEQPYCGDGNLDSGEQCDDGNNIDGDGCSASCTIETYDIHGYKWNDLNGDGLEPLCSPHQSCISEPKLSGWTIELYKDNVKIDEMDTDNNLHFGWYWFEDLPAGEYVICEVLQDGWQQTYPINNNNNNCHTINLPEGDSTCTPDFQENFVNVVEANGQTCNFGNLAQAIIDILKEVDKSVALEGDVLTYTIKVTNTGAAGMYVVVKDTLPANVTLVGGSFSPDPDVIDGDTFTWFVDSAPFSEKVISYQVTVNSGLPLGETLIENTGVLTCSGQTQIDPLSLELDVINNGQGADYLPCDVDDSSTVNTTVTIVPEPFCGDGNIDLGEECDDANNLDNDGCSAICTIEQPSILIPEPTPSIILEKTDSPDPVNAGGEITYTMSYIVSDASVTDLTLTDSVPANTTYVSCTGGLSCGEASGMVSWDFGDVEPGYYVNSATLTVKVAGIITNGTLITNTAILDSNETPEHTATAKTTVNSAPVLTITKVAGTATANPGDTVDYIVRIYNEGSDTAVNLKLADTMPVGFTHDDGSAGNWFFDDLAAGEEKIHIYSVTIDTSVSPGTYTNTAQASADNHDSVTADATIDVVAKQGVVLGEETVGQVLGEATEGKVLAETGASLVDYLLYLIVIITVGFAGFGIKKLRTIKIKK